MKAKDGNWVWVRSTSTAKKQDDDKVLSIGIFMDITYRKQQEEILEQKLVEISVHFLRDREGTI